MRKIILSLLILMMSACGSVNTEYTCEFENDNFKDSTIMYVINDNITKLEATYTNNMQELGYSDVRVKAIIEENTNKYQNSKYITYSAVYSDGVLTEKENYDISLMTPELLKEIGLIETAANEISLSESLKTFKDNGYNCIQK